MKDRQRFLLLFVILCKCALVCSVSFYGDSFVNIPYKDDLHAIDLELRFKTSRSYGVLVLLAGEYDHFLLQMHAGTIQLKANFGGEDTILDLGRHRYDDLDWHNVKVTSSDKIITMVIDDSTTVRETIEGNFRQLNIDQGIFLGGVDAQTNALFGRELKNVRGAFSSALFNGKDLIVMGRELTDPSKVVQVSWDIDEIFDAPRDSPIAFLSDTSFASFAHIHPSNERTVSFLLQPESTSGILVYSSAHHSNGHNNYIALELIDRQLKLTVGKNDVVSSISSDKRLGTDWHQIDISIAAAYLELSVDGTRQVHTIPDESSTIFEGFVYIGGINHHSRSLAISHGLESLKNGNDLKGGLVGCVKDIIINSRSYSLHDIQTSRLIGVNCATDKDCESVECRTASRTLDSTPPHADSSQDDGQILSIKPIDVAENGQADLTTDNIEMVYDYKHYGIRESQILFHVIDPPKYGIVEVDLGRRRINDVFTYLDIIGGKVCYIHRGSEQSFDEIGMEMEIVVNSDGDENVPESLLQRHGFVLPISVRSTNDPPEIVLGNNGVLKIIENTKILLTSSFLLATDSDTLDSQLTFQVVEAPSQGYFEKGPSRTQVNSFTQEEINNGDIWFVHMGTSNVQVGLKVNDGQASSDTVSILVRTVQLQLMVTKNSGLVLPHGAYAIISGENLTTVSNVPSQDLEISYDILQPPRYGVLERQQFVNGEWKEVSNFAQRHVDTGRVRYRQKNMNETPPSDQFKFNVKAKGKRTPYYYFRIQFQQIYLSVETNNKLTLLDKQYGVLSAENLKAVTNNPQLDPEKITFTIVRPPSMGDFYLLDPRIRPPSDFSITKPLTSDTPFTQADIDDGDIYYRLKSNTYETIADFSDLSIETVGASSKIVRLRIEFVPVTTDVMFVNNGLTDVIEGGQKPIERNNLYIQTDDFHVFEFTVIKKPEHGSLQLIDYRSSAVIEDDVSEFTSNDIDLRLVYKHDDSEHDTDSFTFTAVPQISRTNLASSNIPEFPGTFEITMKMRNDNPPKRLVDKVFKVVRNGEKLITIEDIAFTDPDIDYDTDDLTYTRRGITNGQIVKADSKEEQVYQFTQKDIIDGKILFKHIGEDHGRADIYVTDGQFYSNCLLEIEASDPFVNVVENTGALVQSEQKVLITGNNLSLETNVNVKDRDIRFVITEEPRQGHLEINGAVVNEFSLEALKLGKLEYKHEGSSGLEDFFKFTVIAGETSVDSTFSIQILRESSQVPPRVVNNRVLVAHLGDEPNIIRKRHLLITHTDSTANSIEFLVLVLPKRGELFVRGQKLTTDGDTTFTQRDINSGHVKYQVRDMNERSDKFIFEVSNGYEALRGLEFLIDIVPYSLSLKINNFTVIEGGTKTLTTKLLTVDTEHIGDQEMIFTIASPPNFGRVELSNNMGIAIEDFTLTQLESRSVVYVHDNSESSSDWFSISVRLEDDSRESETETVYVTVEGINDEGPVITNNAGLSVWQESMTQITPEILSARDPDSRADRLEYRISAPSNGQISRLDNTFRPILTFTQADIDNGEIVFVHEGAAQGSFSLQVSDGDNLSPMTTFHIIARKLELAMTTRELLHAYPGALQPITAAHLLAVTNDEDQFRPIIFTVTKQPRHGSIVTMVGKDIVKAAQFNQKDLNNSLVYYKHEGQLTGWTQDDQLEFSVNTLYADRIKDQVLDIYISYGNLNAENKNQLIKTSPIQVDEGAEMLVMKKNIDVSEFLENLEKIGKRASLRFTLKNAPKHGQLIFRRKPLLKNVRFSQRDINSHQLLYKHDDSDTLIDSFKLMLHLRIEDQSMPENSNEETTFELVMNVSVQPINDEPFRLLTTNPSIHVIQGFSAAINQSILNTVDKDTTPEYIVYKIHREAVNGHMALVENPDKKINVFTQQDVNEGRVVFKHDFHGESGQAQTGTLNFHVSDGSSPYYDALTIYVTKIFIHLTQNSTLIVIQSNSSERLSQDNLNISTNGLRENVVYSILNQPRFGKIYVNSRISNSFTQVDIDRNAVVYFQTDLQSGSDLFEFSISYKNDQHSTVSFYERVAMYIRVKPLVKTGPLEAPKGERVAITLLSLDASMLSERTGDNPVYEIRLGPYFGKIVKSSHSKRQVHSLSYRTKTGHKVVDKFSHEDVVYMKVFYESDVHNTPTRVQDNFTYVLRAFGAQPAEGVYHIGLTPSDLIPIMPVTVSTKQGEKPVSVDPVTQSTGELPKGDKSSVNETIEPSRLKHDHVIILAISIPLLIIITVIIIVIYFVWKNRRKQDFTPSSKKSPRPRPHISSPFQIEQPHVHIQPQEPGSPVSDESKSLVVEYENMTQMPSTSKACSEDGDVIMPMIMTLPPGHQQNAPRSPDISRTEISATVPTCKVTPLIDNDRNEEELEGAVGGYTDDHRQSLSSMGDMIEWITNDPELMQHCSSSSPPELRNSQYWV